MKKVLLLYIAFASFFYTAFEIADEEPVKKNNPMYQISAAVDSRKLDGNNISTWYRTNGSFNRDPYTGNGGFEWPKASGKYARYASGLWLGCVAGNDTLTAVAEYSYDFLHGYVDNNGNPQGYNDPAYRIYKISFDSIGSSDYRNWPVNQGAYVNSDGTPHLIGVQTMFYVYTDAYPHSSGSTSIRSLKAQILQTNWCFNDYGALSNTIYSEYRIINRSNEVWTNAWMGIWADDDLGDAVDDKIGCDTNLSLGYTYNSTNHDNIYGNAPPAVGFVYFRGALIYTGNSLDTVKYYSPPGSNNLIKKIGFKDLGMTVFNTYNDASPQPSDPLNNQETFRVLKGLWRLGDSWINPVTNAPTTKTYSGDPVAGTGWIMAGGNDRRMLLSSGPFTMNPGDTQTIVCSQVIARGNSNLNSVTVLKQTSKISRAMLESNFKYPAQTPAPIVTKYAPGDGKIYLTWNDSPEKTVIANPLSGGIYRFQGYNVYQIKNYSPNPSKSDTVLVKTFDVIDGVKNIYDSTYLGEYGGYVFGIVQHGSDNGISRFITLTKDTISNKGFVNGTEYKFAVTSYMYDSVGGVFTYPKMNESVFNVFSVVPQNLTPSAQINYKYGDTINTDQKDLAVMPVVIKPFELVNATYTSTFGGTIQNPTWTLTKNSNGKSSVLFQDITDFTGTQDTAFTVDGFLLVNQRIIDSGIVRDPSDLYPYYSWIWGAEPIETFSKQKSWTYTPAENLWFSGPDTQAIRTAKFFTGKKFQSTSLGMSFPTVNNFRSVRTRIFANSSFISRDASGTSPTFTGGPLRKIKIVFGQSQKAYRYKSITGNVLLSDTNILNTPFAGMTDIPFSAYMADELDSSGGVEKQINVAFIDSDNDSLWNPDTTAFGKYQITYFLTSDYDSIPWQPYTLKNPGTASPSNGFPTMDIMYAWVPKVLVKNGAPATFANGDVLTVTPYRLTRPDFVPGYPVKYSWKVNGTNFDNASNSKNEVNRINVFPNPYYGFSELEYNAEGDKFIYFSNLPASCTIYIYTLDGVLVNRINRNNTDPNNTLEKWDLKNSSGSFVASGIYIVYVNCNGLGAKTLKMAVFERN